MSTERSLESLLRDKATAPDCQQCTLWTNYTATKNHLAQYYYPWVQANAPWFTDHGQKHVDSVIHTAGQLLSAFPESALSCLDLYILLTATIWHDVGIVCGRAGHAREVQQFIDKVREFCFLDPALYRLVCQVVRAHSGREGWSSLQSSEPVTACTHKTCTVYPQSIAALLRFADDASETRTRISPPLLESVPIQQRIYWAYAHSITASKPEPEPARKRLLLAIELQRAAATERFPCPRDYLVRADKSKRISLIEYLVCRLERMNNERAYCFPYLTRYADIRTIEVRIQVCHGTDSESIEDIVLGDGGLSQSAYPAIPLFDRFFEAHPQLTPSRLEGGT